MGWLALGFALLGISVWINIVSIDKAYLAHRHVGDYGLAQALGTLSLIAATLGGLALGVVLGTARAVDLPSLPGSTQPRYERDQSEEGNGEDGTRNRGGPETVSIYATMLYLLDFWEWKERTETSGISIYGAPPDDEEKLGGPYRYEGSNVVPTTNHPRDGLVEVSYIPDHIAEWDDIQSVDYLRISVGEKMDEEGCVEDQTVILDRPQVEALREALSWWLDAPERP